MFTRNESFFMKLKVSFTNYSLYTLSSFSQRKQSSLTFGIAYRTCLSSDKVLMWTRQYRSGVRFGIENGDMT